MLRTRTAGILNPAGPEMGSSGSRYSSSQFSLVFLTTNQNRIFHYKPSSYWGIMRIILIFVLLVTLPPWIILPWIPWIAHSLAAWQPGLSHPGPRTSKRSRAWSTAPSSSVCCWMQLVALEKWGFPMVFPMKKAMIPGILWWYLGIPPFMGPQDVEKLATQIYLDIRDHWRLISVGVFRSWTFPRNSLLSSLVDDKVETLIVTRANLGQPRYQSATLKD